MWSTGLARVPDIYTIHVYTLYNNHLSAHDRATSTTLGGARFFSFNRNNTITFVAPGHAVYLDIETPPLIAMINNRDESKGTVENV